MSRIIIQNSLYQNKNREEVKNREIRYLPDLFTFNLLSVFVLAQRILNYYPNCPNTLLYLKVSPRSRDNWLTGWRWLSYRLYAWCCPLVFATVATLMALLPGVSSCYIKPNFGTYSCFFSCQCIEL